MLVVDDEALVRDFLREALTRRSYHVDIAEDGKQAREVLKEQSFDLVLTDLKMPGVTGLDLLKFLKAHQPDTPVIMMTAYGTIENAVEAMRLGAFDYITKPFTSGELELILDRAFEHRRLISENRNLKDELCEKYGFGAIIGRSKAIQEVFELMRVVAPNHTTILIEGESGTGKELVARAIHYNSPRKDKPFIKINCAALPEGLIESELFGHEKGAYTHAYARSRGKFELADGGTILFDEIGEMAPGLQAKLLRVLQEREFERIGGSETIQVDVRVIATTNRNLEEEVEKGRFRKDLYYRLNVISIHLPSLSRRREDIPLLAYHFLQRYGQEYGKGIGAISEEALLHLCRCDWPGNVRELANRVERAVVMCRGNCLEMSDFMVGGRARSNGLNDFPQVPGVTLHDMEKWLILKTLEAQKHNRTKTAQILDISIRTLRNKIKEYRDLDGDEIN
ncbi:MAG: sigma-54-dependent Fis family transcriptional regulator [Candidatus Zixiibacteriota bacterium]|nr:MAG: sigma-54-dependent Fis family transcriptional regulator [candidate division Zixibacteria bacterium]